MTTPTDCLFCKIRDGQIPAAITYRDEHPLAFKDIVSKEPKWGQRWPALNELQNIATVDWKKLLPVIQETTDLFARKVGR